MPEVLGSPPSPRTALFWNGTAWQWALVDAAGHLQIDTVTSALPAGAATEATLATLATEATLVAFAGGAATEARLIITNTLLTQIASLRNALESRSLDRLIVRGEDQHFSIKGVLAVRSSGNPSGADGYLESPGVPAGEYWIVTTVAAMDNTTALTGIEIHNRHNAINYALREEVRAIAIGEYASWGGHTYLDVDDVIRVYYPGCLAGDTVYLQITGYRMTVES